MPFHSAIPRIDPQRASPRYQHAGYKPIIGILLGLGFLNALPILAPNVTGPWPASLYLPAHSVLEVVAVAIAAMIFAISWEFNRHNITLRSVILCSAFFCVAWMDLSHLLSYQGMPAFITPSGPQKAINFWLAARLIAAVALLLIILPFANRPANQSYRQAGLLLAILLTVILHIWFLGFPDSVPATFITEKGLTSLKIGIEYSIIMLNLCAVALLVRYRHTMTTIHAPALLGAVVTMAYSETYFTLYTHVTDIYNLLGHVVKIVSYGFLYRAIFYEAIQSPYRRLEASQAELSATLSAIPDLLLETDSQGYLYKIHDNSIAPTLRHWLKNLSLIHHQQLPEPLLALVQKGISQARRQQSCSDPLQLSSDIDNQIHWLQFSAVPMSNDSDTLERYLLAFRDITNEKLAQASQQINALAFHTREAIMITDEQQRIIRVNPAFTEITGYTEHEVMGHTPRMLRSGRHDKDFYAALWQDLLHNGVWAGEIYNKRKDGTIYPQHIVINSVTNHEGIITHYIASFSDISEFKAAQEHIHHLAYYDVLTGLPNRRLLVDRIKEAQLEGQRTQQISALLFIDLDYFKRLNDSLGHSFGDELLRQLAERLLNCLRAADTLARPGGDEFIVLVRNLGQVPLQAAADAHQLAEKLLHAIAEPFNLRGTVYRITASIGIHLFNDQSMTLDDVMSAADLAMYHAKEKGRNQVHAFESAMQQRLIARNQREQDLNQAIAEQQFVLFYQPKFDHARTLVGYEALIRWQHPEQGLLGPIEFIDLAENTGQIIAIGQWVLEQACRDAVLLNKRHEGYPLTIAINVSERQVRQVDFVAQVAQALTSANLPATQIEIEITESLLHEDLGATREKLDALHALGASIALDDFGTGYSSLSYLKQLPLNVIKIDQSFVRNLLTDEKDHAIVQAILAMADALSLSVVAEGVETAEHFNELHKMGCPTFQGYYFSKPVPLTTLLAHTT